MRHLNWPSLALAATLLPLCASADVRAWRADLASEEVRNEYVRRGDSATLRVAVYLRGREYRPATAVARYRAGLDSPDWLQAPCSVASNVVEVAWTPLLAPGADVVPMLVHVDGEVYRVPVMLYVRDSPGGDEPGGLPVLDFGAYALTNAPWALPADIPAPPVTSVNGKTGEVALAASDVGAATVADATLNGRGPNHDGFSEWTVAATDPQIPGPYSLRWNAEAHSWGFYSGSQLFGAVYNSSIDAMSVTLSQGPSIYTATRMSLPGYQLGSQSDKPLAAASHTHPAEDITDLPPAPDYSATNAALVATIQAVAPPPGDYATVSNLATSAVQPSELPGLVPEYIVSPETARGTAYTGVSRDTALRDGKMILYYMQTQATAAWTLNLTLADGTTTGAKPVRFWGTTAIGTQYAAGSIIPLVYRGGAWYFSDRDSNNDTYDRNRITSYVRFSAQTTKYAICCGTADGYRKVAPGVVFDASMPILYANVNATSAAGAQNNNLYSSMPNIDVRNTVAGFASRRGKPLYLVGSLADDGRTFTIGDPALSYEPTPPCIPLGIFNNNADNQLYFLPGPLIAGQTGGDASAVTNLVSDILAEEVGALPVQSTLEVHRLVLADLWDRVDRMAGTSDADAIDDILLALDGLDARLTALEESAASTAASISALSAMSSLRLQSADLQSDGTAPATSVQDPSDPR